MWGVGDRASSFRAADSLTGPAGWVIKLCTQFLVVAERFGLMNIYGILNINYFAYFISKNAKANRNL